MLKKKPSSIDVASRAGVSTATVSYVFNGRKNASVPDETRRRVLEAAELIGYRPNHAARTLATGQSRVIALQIFDMENPHQQRVAHTLADLLSTQDFDLVVHGYASDSLRVRWSIDGTIILDRGEYPELDLHSPVVGIGAYVSDEVDSVMVDLEVGARDALAHLIASGRRRIVHLAKSELKVGDGRTKAYGDAVQSSELPTLRVNITNDKPEDGYAALRAFLQDQKPPDAVFCQNDQVAAGAYRALREYGLRIPPDVAVIGCDGLDQNKFLNPVLASIEQPIDTMCAIGWAFLRNRIADPSIPRQTAVLQSHFVPAESC